MASPPPKRASVPIPQEDRWTAAQPKFVDYIRGGARVAPVPDPVLSKRDFDLQQVSIGEPVHHQRLVKPPRGKPVSVMLTKVNKGAAEAGHDLPVLSLQPQSARGRTRGNFEKVRHSAPRSRSVDAAQPGTRLNAGSVVPVRQAEGRGDARSGQPRENEAFFRVLEEMCDGGVHGMDLDKLGVIAGPSRRPQEVVRLLRTLLAPSQPADDSTVDVSDPTDVEHMAAQVAYMEKKVLRLRDKLKRRGAREAKRQDVEKSAMALDLETASTEELAAEVAHLRSERQRLEHHQVERSPPSRGGLPLDLRLCPSVPQSPRTTKEKRGLKSQLSQLRQQSQELAAAKDAAIRSAETSEALRQACATRLLDMVEFRERDRLKLEVEVENMQKEVEKRSIEMQELELSQPRPGVEKQELEVLRLQIFEAEQQLDAVQRPADGLPGSCSSSLKRLSARGFATPSTGSARVLRQDASSRGSSASPPRSVDTLTLVSQRNSTPRPVLSSKDTRLCPPGSAVSAHVEGGSSSPRSLHSSSTRLRTCGVPFTEPQGGTVQLDRSSRLNSRGSLSPPRVWPADALSSSRGHSSTRSSGGRLTVKSDEIGDGAAVGPLLSPEREAELSEELQEFSKRRDDAAMHLASLCEKFRLKREEDALALQESECELLSLRNEEQLCECQNRGEMADAMEQRRQALAAEACRSSASRLGGDSDAVWAARDELRDLAAQYRDTEAAEQEQSLARLAKLEDRLLASHSMALQVRREHNDLAARQQDLRRRFVLALRPETYQRKELLYYVSRILEMDSSQFRVLDEKYISSETRCWDLMQVQGEPLAEPDDVPDGFVRPLPTYQPWHGSKEDATIEGLKTVDSTSLRHTLSDARLVKVSLEVANSGDVGVGEDAWAPAVVERLAAAISSGGSLLEDLSVVAMCCVRGSVALGDGDGGWLGDQAWCEELGESVARVSRSIGGRQLLITVQRTLRPFILKFMATHHAQSQEFVLFLNEADLQSLLGENSSLFQPDLGQQLVETVLDRLHFLEDSDRKSVLVAIQAVAAPLTALNGEVQTLAVNGVEAEAVVALHTDVSHAVNVALLPDSGELTTMAPKLKSDGSVVALEDVLLVEDVFIVLSICEDFQGTLLVRLQETGGVYQAVEARLPGHGHPRTGMPLRQQRLFAQSFEIRHLALYLSVEDIALPPGLLVRVSRSFPNRPAVHCDPDQRVYWLSRADESDGGLFAPNPAVLDATVSAARFRHRERLLDFVCSELPEAGDVNVQEGLVEALHPPMLSLDGSVEETQKPTEDDPRLFTDTSVKRTVEEMEVVSVPRKLMEASVRTGGQHLLKAGRRVPGPGGMSALCVVSVREHSDPYFHFAIMAHEVGAGRCWPFLADSLHVFRSLRSRVSLERDVVARRELARLLVQSLVLVDSGRGDWQLVLADARPKPNEEEVEPTTPQARDLSIVDRTCSSHYTYSLQDLTQEEAARFVRDEEDLCLLNGTRTLGGVDLDVRVFDDPDKSSVLLSVINLLVVVRDPTWNLYFSTRVNDKRLKQALTAEENTLLLPQNRTALLSRLLASIDLRTTFSASGNHGEMLVLQHECPKVLPELRPNSSGTLVPVDPRPESVDSKGDVLALCPPDCAISLRTVDSCESRLALKFKSGVEGRILAPLHVDLPDVQIGSVCYKGVGETESAASCQRHETEFTEFSVGGTDVQVSLCMHTDAHVLKLQCMTSFGPFAGHSAEVQIPAAGDPTRVYIEYLAFAGMDLVVAVAQQACPHELCAHIFCPESRETDVSLTVRDGATLLLVEPSVRTRLCDSGQQLLRFGALLRGRSLHREVTDGREFFPSDVMARGLQCHVPVVRTCLGPVVDPDEPASAQDLLFACTRFVLSPETLDELQKNDDLVALDGNVPALRISLLKKRACRNLTLSIENVSEWNKDIPCHVVCMRDKMTDVPHCLYAESQVVGDIRLHTLVMEDSSPSSVRIAVLEPTSGWSFQLVVVGTDAPAVDPQTLLASTPRNELLQHLLRKLGSRAALPPNLHPMQLVSSKKAARSPVILNRETRFVLGKNMVLITVTCDTEEGGPLVFKAFLSHILSGKQTHLHLVNPGMDVLLSTCGLPKTTELRDHHLSVEGVKDIITRSIFDSIEVLPSLEMRFRHSSCAGELKSRMQFGQDVECDASRLIVRAERAVTMEHVDGDDEASHSRGLCVEVFDCSDTVDALFHSTNLRVRVSDGDMVASRDLHEEDLTPWLSAASVDHLLCASREADLINLVLSHAMLSADVGVILENLREEAVAGERYALELIDSAKCLRETATAWSDGEGTAATVTESLPLPPRELET